MAHIQLPEPAIYKSVGAIVGSVGPVEVTKTGAAAKKSLPFPSKQNWATFTQLL